MRIRFVLVVLLQLALMTPWALNAQDMNDNFFYIEEESYRDATVNTQAQGIWGNMTVTDYEDGTILPLGDGLWLLAAVAGLYLIIRTRKSRKAATMMAAALALTLGMTQCRKPQPNEPVTPTGETIFISLTGGNGGGAKTNVEVNTGKITWNEGDKVYVVNDGKLLGGNLTAQPGCEDQITAVISGYVTGTIDVDKPFYFYYVGKGVDFTPTNGATSLTFNIANQNGNNGADLNDAGEYMIGRTEAVEMAETSGVYRPATDPTLPRAFTPLTAVLWLDSQVGFGECTMTMSGAQVSNEMSINLSAPTPSYTTGSITFTSSNKAQISVMPTTPADADQTFIFSSSSKSGLVTVKNGIKAGNVYAKLCDGGVYPIPVAALPEGALPGLFSVAADKKVMFSKGNLQYIGSATPKYWKLADNQWSYFGTSTNQGSSNQDVDRDLFGYGTSGYNGKMPYMTSKTNSDYPSVDFMGDNVNYDWGVYNAISNGGNKPGIWRTLNNTMPENIGVGGDWHCHGGEWDYLVYDRDNNADYNSVGKHLSGIGTLTLNDLSEVLGVFLLPDNYYELPGAKQWMIKDGNDGKFKWAYTQDEITQYDIVFLPRAGSRTQTSVRTDDGNYWTSSHNPNDSNRACNIYFFFSDDLKQCKLIQTTSTPSYHKYSGYAVRLVQDANPNAAVNEDYIIGPAIDWGN